MELNWSISIYWLFRELVIKGGTDIAGGWSQFQNVQRVYLQIHTFILHTYKCKTFTGVNK